MGITRQGVQKQLGLAPVELDTARSVLATLERALLSTPLPAAGGFP
jgi:hypothetical protein